MKSNTVFSRFWKTIVAITTIATLPSLSACRSTAKVDPGVPLVTDQGVVPYPRGRWRLASTEELGRVELWVAHILIRHERSDRTALSVPGIQVQPPPPARNRAEALKLARSIEERAAAAPERFGDLAREYSEDVVTGPNGGSLGGISVPDLFLDGQILDALANLRPGQVSRVIETTHGFHVIRRGVIPAAVTVAAKSIIIGYDTPVPTGLPELVAGRTRAEALEDARIVATELRADPSRFDRIFAQYRAPNRWDRNGNLGVWSNQEIGILAREREQLAGAAVGDVVGPVDTAIAFEVLIRTPLPPDWTEIGVQVVKLPFRKGAPSEGPDSRENAIALARSFLPSIDAPRFDELLRRYCCEEVERWSRGHVDETFSDVAEKLAIGEISRTPLEDRSHILLVRRVDPGPPAPVVFELPVPTTVDLKKLAIGTSGSGVQRTIKDLGKAASSSLGLSETEARRVAALHEQLAMAFAPEEAHDTRVRAMDLFFHDMQETLTKPQYEKYYAMAMNFAIAQRMSLW